MLLGWLSVSETVSCGQLLLFFSQIHTHTCRCSYRKYANCCVSNSKVQKPTRGEIHSKALWLQPTVLLVNYKYSKWFHSWIPYKGSQNMQNMAINTSRCVLPAIITTYRSFLVLLQCLIHLVSRHTVCRAAQETSAQHPWVYWQEERKRNFCTSVALCCLDETRQFLLWTLPPTSALHIPILSKIASSVPEICDFKNWLSFFVFFPSYLSFFFRTLVKTAIKHNCHIRLPWNLAHRRGI